LIDLPSGENYPLILERVLATTIRRLSYNNIKFDERVT